MHAVPGSPFETLEICRRLLSTGPAGLALDGRRLGHGLPAHQITLVELRVLLQHPTATADLQLAVLDELVRLAAQLRGRWMVGLAGVLLPGLRRIAASIAAVDGRADAHVEGDLLELVRDAIDQHASGAAQLALGVVQFTRRGTPFPPIGCGDPLGP